MRQKRIPKKYIACSRAQKNQTVKKITLALSVGGGGGAGDSIGRAIKVILPRKSEPPLRGSVYVRHLQKQSSPFAFPRAGNERYSRERDISMPDPSILFII